MRFREWMKLKICHIFGHKWEMLGIDMRYRVIGEQMRYDTYTLHICSRCGGSKNECQLTGVDFETLRKTVGLI